MIANWTQLLLLLPVVWPLLLVGALVTPGLRGAALRLLPWAALPALAASVLPVGAQVQLPGFLLGSALVMDGTGRVFLLLNALLWLAGGMLATRSYRITPPSQFAVLLLFAMSGTMGMAMTAEALLFFACATITGYSLLGLLICQGHGPSRRAGGILVVLLVVSDLVLYELFLDLAHETVGTDFASLRHAMAESHSRGLLLGLLFVGLGIKTGMAGLHFWLVPAIMAATTTLRPVLVSFILTAGILAWVRLLPLGDVQWTGAGDLLRWLGAITVAYAVVAGARDIGSSVTAYAAMTMNGVLLAAMGVALSDPQLWVAVAAAWPAMLQAGWALTAWMLIEAHGCDGRPTWREVWLSRLRWVAVVLLAASPLALTEAPQTAVDVLPILLAVASVFFIAYVPAVSRDRRTSRSPSDRVAGVSAGMASGLTALVLLMASLLSTIYGFSRLSPANFIQAAWMLPAAAVLAWLLSKPLISALRCIPTVSCGGSIFGALTKAVQSGLEIIGTRVAHWRDRLFDRIRILLSNPVFPELLGAGETRMTRWRNAFALILMAMLVAVAWSWEW